MRVGSKCAFTSCCELSRWWTSCLLHPYCQLPVYSSPPYLRLHVPQFQLPSVNCGPKILTVVQKH